MGCAMDTVLESAGFSHLSSMLWTWRNTAFPCKDRDLGARAQMNVSERKSLSPYNILTLAITSNTLQQYEEQ